MRYLWSMKLAERKDAGMSLKISYFLITLTLLVLEFDPNTTLLFTLISQPKNQSL